MDKITANNCAGVTDNRLAGITGTLTVSIESLAAGDFAGLTSLSELNLTGGSQTELPAEVFVGLTSLNTLRLTGGALTAVPAGAFAGLNELVGLDLTGHPLATLPAGVFAGLPSLDSLSLQGNQLSTLPGDVFAGLSLLNKLRLDTNKLGTLAPGQFAGLTSLNQLRLEDNELANLPAGVFEPLAALTILNLSSNKLDNLPAGVFEPLTALTDLYLNNNTGADFAPEAVALPDGGTVSSEGGMVTLDGSGSGGLWGTNVTYGWSQTSGPTSGVMFDDAASAKPVVTIPALTVGAELVFTLTVTGRGGMAGITTGTDDATVTVTVPPSDDATLRGLTVNDGTSDLTLGPTFAPGTFGYTASVTHAVEEVTLTATLNHTGAQVSAVTLSGNAIADSDFTDGITIPSLLVGANEIVVTVTAEDTVTTQAYTVTVTRAANSAPAASDGSVTTNEDTAHTFAEGEFNFNDSDAGDALASVTVVTLPAAGGLTLDGVAVTADQVVSRADIDADKLVYTPLTNANGTDYASFTFRVSDGKDESASAHTMTVNVTPVNDEATGRPTISGTAQVGHELTAAIGDIADVDGLPATFPDDYTFQWVRVGRSGNETNIGTDSTYLLSDTDVGSTIRVEVSFTDLAGNDEEPLVSDAYPASGAIGGICDRTAKVRNYLVDRISGVSNCADVTDAHLATITTLNLAGRSISSLKTRDFAGLRTATTLNLASNQLETLPVGVFDGLDALQKLNLNGNALQTLPVGVFGGLAALQELNLNSNALQTLPVGVFDRLDALQKLNLNSNALATLPVRVFDGLDALQDLNLTGNALETLPAGLFDGLAELSELYLLANDLLRLPEDVFDGLGKLTDLQLQDNDLTALPEDVFDGLDKLTDLDLDGNGLTALPAGVFAGLKALARLNLSQNDLTVLPTGVFAGLSKLATLHLHFNALTTAGLPDGVFEPLAALNYLNLKNNPGAPFSPEAVAGPDNGTVPIAGGQVPLDGSASKGGPWGTNVTYRWALTDAPSGVTVDFDNDMSARPEVTIGALEAGAELTFTLTVTGRATDTALGTSPATATATVTAAAANAGPEFSSPVTFDAAENQTAAGTVAASDADTEDSVTGYTIEGGADAGQFSLDAGSGVLTFVAAPNYEDPADADGNNAYEVEVQATSGTGAREKMADQTITVTVTDEVGAARRARHALGVGGGADESDGELERAVEQRAADHGLRPAVPGGRQRGLHGGRYERVRDEQDHRRSR